VRRHAARMHKAHQPLLSPRRPRARARLSTEEKLMAGNLSQNAAGHPCRGARLAGPRNPFFSLSSPGHATNRLCNMNCLRSDTENFGKEAAFVQ